MGNCNFKSSENPEEPSIIRSIEVKAYIEIIGKGGFSMVWKVENKKTKQFVALKMMSKAKIISKKSVHSAMNELTLLSSLRHSDKISFLINMIFAFQDKRRLYLGMDYLSGGDLRYHICKVRRFTEEQSKFMVACLFLGLEYLHSNSVIHRDIKPENLVFDERGYLHVTDLGIARIWKPQNAQDTSGTPGYMAPEVMCRQNHGVAVDYYALGVIMFELILGYRPYVGKNRQEIREQILAKQVQIEHIPDGWSPESIDFTNKLIQRKIPNRLGSNGPDEIKNHPWLRNCEWELISTKFYDPPFIPDHYSGSSQNKYIDSKSDLDEQNELLLRRDSIQNLFSGYTFGAGTSIYHNHTMTSSRSQIVPVKSFL